MKKPFSITELSLKILRISIGIAIAVSIIGYYIDVSQTSTIVIQGIPELSSDDSNVSEQEPTQTSETTTVTQTEPSAENAHDTSVEIPAETTSVATEPPETSTSAPAAEQPITIILNSEANAQQNDAADVAPEISESGFININTASAAELMALDGIGEVKAAAIVEYRREHGEFRSVDELLNVKGIGEKTLEKNRSRITVN
ncbi:MAG: helix-hairpin-helix domain-containing protein [Oscillospiraceae bacterium]|nr:helix-hairpin-helix domain-containing protein [Oscillospiraceae bacterium]